VEVPAVKTKGRSGGPKGRAAPPGGLRGSGKYREGQEDKLGALGLVVNMIVLWNTIDMEAILDQLRAEGNEVRDEDLACLSPLICEPINRLGRYSFTVPEAVARCESRALRDPNVDLDD
jgi:hypothetical protein